jgi:hypothetical protein
MRFPIANPFSDSTTLPRATDHAEERAHYRPTKPITPVVITGTL